MTVTIRVAVSVEVLLFALAAFLAWRNFRAGRGDIRGATRLAAFIIGVETLEWLCTAHHVSEIDELFGLFFLGIMWAGFIAALLWALYVALEPYVRRHWPQSIISWSRLLGGGVRDPLVAGHLLIGIAVGVGAGLVTLVERLLAPYGQPDPRLSSVLDARQMIGVFLQSTVRAVAVALSLFLVLFLLRMLLRRQWLAATVFVVLLTGIGVGLSANGPVIDGSFAAILTGLYIFVVTRFGVLSFAMVLLSGGFPLFLLTTDFSTWYAGSTIFALAVVLVVTAYAFHTALAGVRFSRWVPGTGVSVPLSNRGSLSTRYSGGKNAHIGGDLQPQTGNHRVERRRRVVGLAPSPGRHDAGEH